VVLPPVWCETPGPPPGEGQGEPRCLAITSTWMPLFDKGGQVDHVVTLFRDVTAELAAREQLEAERDQLRESESRFHRIFESLPMAALFSRLSDRRFIEVNDAWLRLTGWSRAETIGATSVEQHLWQDPERRDDLFRELMEHGRVRDFAARLCTRSGALRQVLLSVDRVELGREPCLLLLAHDVTELRELERELRQAQKMEAVGRLAGGVAHDFNNILTAMSGADALLLEGLAETDPLRRFAEQIKRSISRAAILTRQLLTFTRKQPIQPVVVDPNEAVRAIDEMLRRMIGADIELRCELRALGRVKADPGALEQVLMNLAVNARDAMPGGGTLSLRTADLRGGGAVPDGEWVQIEVADTGVGMDAATRARLFEPFFTTKEQGKGTGLGLSTVYGIVRQSRGHIEVDSEPGHGSHFRILLPRAVEARPAEARAADQGALPTGHETILLVEDDEAVRELVHFVLERLGYHVIDASDGVEALAVAASHTGTIDLLLSDLVMPRMDGRQLAVRLRLARPGLKVIHMSGYPGGQADGEIGLDDGTTFLPKPFERQQLARLVRATLDTSPSR
jgi:PAS domain S-box-containing protein